MPRLVQIARVLRRHHLLPALLGEHPWPAPEHVREAIEELGTVFLKFGQVLAVRRDLIPAAYVAELERLHDRVPTLPVDVVRAALRDGLGRPIEDVFARFDDEPLAAATIAQVHRARMPDGREVVVKVQRPGLAQRIAEDIGVLTYLATLAEGFSPRLRGFEPVALVHEFHESLTREMDFTLEAENVRRFAAALEADAHVWVPRVTEEASSATVLTLEHSPGVRIDRYAAEHPEQAERLAATVADLLLRQVFEAGLFHADPHPGNVFVLPDGRVCLHDFGMVGTLPAPLRETLVELLTGVVRADARQAADAYLAMGLVGEDMDRGPFEAELDAVLQQVRELPLAEVSVSRVLEAMMQAGSRHQIRNPGSLLLLLRTFAISEALLRALAPDMDMLAVFGREMRRVQTARFAPAHVLERGRALAWDLERLLREAPADTRRILRRLADGALGTVRAPEVELLARRADRALERLAGGIASAAFVTAGALLASVPGWHRAAGDVLLALGVAGTLAVAIGAWRSR